MGGTKHGFLPHALPILTVPELFLSQFLSIEKPLLLPVPAFAGRTICTMTLAMNPPFHCSIGIFTGRAIGSMKKTIPIKPGLVAMTNVYEGGHIVIRHLRFFRFTGKCFSGPFHQDCHNRKVKSDILFTDTTSLSGVMSTIDF